MHSFEEEEEGQNNTLDLGSLDFRTEHFLSSH
jgi:hypothetical protein